jgi:hypothetical protein
MLVDVTQAILNDQRKFKEYERQQRQDIFDHKIYSQERDYIANLNRQRTKLLAENGLYSVTYIIDYTHQ